MTPRERLQPSLLDRLTDDEPGNPQESADRRVLSMNQLKASVLRDLTWLFNTIALLDADTTRHTPAGTSVINYGLPPLAGGLGVAVVSANLRGIDLGTAVSEVRQMVAENPLGAGVGMHIGGQGEELAESVNSLLFAFGLAVFLVYLVMASQFENLLQPMLILFTVPLAGAGAVLGLWLTDTRISVIVFIGFIMLAGIVVNNAIVLIDRINQLRAEGWALADAIIESGGTRLRPVLMTTLTTVLGLLPMVFGGEGAELRAPMAITVIFGLSLSTLLTLFFIPVIYHLTARKTA